MYNLLTIILVKVHVHVYFHTFIQRVVEIKSTQIIYANKGMHMDHFQHPGITMKISLKRIVFCGIVKDSALADWVGFYGSVKIFLISFHNCLTRVPFCHVANLSA